MLDNGGDDSMNSLRLLLFPFFSSLEYRRILKNGAPCVGLGYVQKTSECFWEDEFLLPRLASFSFRLHWLIDIE